jgi:lysophospholipase L1-like esterase
MVSEPVYKLASNTSGIIIRFVTDAPEIHARWKLTSPNLAMAHMTSTGVSGLDLYVRKDGQWRWLALGHPSKLDNEVTLIAGLDRKQREYALYLPLYNGVSHVELGVPEHSSLDAAPPRKQNIKPVVFFGASIVQGGCATRPGMSYPAIIGRRLDIPFIDLGFSGYGQCDHKMAELLAELDPSVYVITALPDSGNGVAEECTQHLLDTIQAQHPRTPVILLEHTATRHALTTDKDWEASTSRNRVMEKVFKDNYSKWSGRLFYIKRDHLLGSDGDATIDGLHPTDAGFLRMVDIITPVISNALFKNNATFSK